MTAVREHRDHKTPDSSTSDPVSSSSVTAAGHGLVHVSGSSTVNSYLMVSGLTRVNRNFHFARRIRAFVHQHASPHARFLHRTLFRSQLKPRSTWNRLEPPLDFRDAEHRAYRALAPSLSSISTYLDIPMHVWRILITELASRAVHIGITASYREVSFALAPDGTMSVEFRAFSSLYREGLESKSSVYRFLCFFKVAEGIRLLRSRRAKEARANGRPFTRPDERVPRDELEFVPWLLDIFPTQHEWDEMALEAIFQPEARGRRFGDLLKHKLCDLRDDIAHALTDKSGAVTLSVDEALHLERLNKWLPLMKCIVRRMLRNEFPDEHGVARG